MEGDAAEGFGCRLVGVFVVVLGLDVGDVVVWGFEMGRDGLGVLGLFGCGWEGGRWLCEGHCILCIRLLFSMRVLLDMEKVKLR